MRINVHKNENKMEFEKIKETVKTLLDTLKSIPMYKTESERLQSRIDALSDVLSILEEYQVLKSYKNKLDPYMEELANILPDNGDSVSDDELLRDVMLILKKERYREQEKAT